MLLYQAISFELNSRVRSLVKVLSGILLLLFASKITIPFYPVPFTLQTLTLLLLPFLCGKKLSLLATSIWVLIGCIGVPVFSGTMSGMQYILGPTGGYIIGLLVASFMHSLIDINLFVKRIYIFSLLIIFFFGVSWLSHFIEGKSAIIYGFLIFIPSELIKALAFFKLYNSYIKPTSS